MADCLVLVAHKIYGVPQTINSANYVYFLAYQEVFKIPYVFQAERPYILHLGLPRWNSSNSGLRFVRILNGKSFIPLSRDYPVRLD